MRYRILLVIAATAGSTAQSYRSGSLADSIVRSPGIVALDGGHRTSTGLNGADGANVDAPWKTAGADENLRLAFERATYSIKDSGHGTYRAVNPAQRITLEFTDEETRLGHRRGNVTFQLTGYGYGDRLRKPKSAKLTAAGNRVEYQRGELTEWYVNGSQGLEQGFTFAHRPGTEPAVEPLVVSLGVTGELKPVSEANGTSISFQSKAGIVLRYGGLKAFEVSGKLIPSRIEVKGGEIRLIVEDQDAQYPLVIDPTWTQQQELTAADGAVNDFFGTGSVSGDTAVIGAYGKNNSQGVAYLFVRSRGGGWSQQQELTASDGAAGGDFGYSVSVSGDTAVIGAPSETAYPSSNKGTAYVFVRSAGVWTQQQELTASDGTSNDWFGSSVSVSGDTAVIGAQNKINAQGAAYVFVRSGGVWTQQQELTTSDSSNGFGFSVSVSGDTTVVGAYHGAYVFVRTTGAWNQQQKLAASDGAVNDQFGLSVSVSGDTAVIGAFTKTIGSNLQQGAAYVFARSGGAWTQQQELTASDGAANDLFGTVSVSGDTAVIGAQNKINAQGAAYVFVRRGAVWTQQQELTAAEGLARDGFGSSVSVSGDTVVIGAVGKYTLQGAAYMFASPTLGTDAILVSNAAGSSSVVLAYSGAWTAIANDSFLHISAGSTSGSGGALVMFTYDSFGGLNSRTGTLTIAGITVTVTQAGVDYLGPSGSITLVSSGLNNPRGLAVDSSGNVYMADTGSNTILKWNAATQQVSTIVSGLNAPTGVAVDSADNLYIADTGNNAIKEWNVSTQELTTLVSSGLSGPSGVVVDTAGNVYIADTGNNAIKEWSPSTQVVKALVSIGLSGPSGVAVDLLGNVYFSDSGNNAIKKWVLATQGVITLASAALGQPSGIVADGSGNIYFTTSTGVQEWSATNQQVTTLGLTGGTGLAVDGNGNLYESSANRIVEWSNSFVGPSPLSVPGDFPYNVEVNVDVIPATSLIGVYSPTFTNYYPSWLRLDGISPQEVLLTAFPSMSYSTQTATLAVLGRTVTITQPPAAAPRITLSHQGNFVRGQQGAQYTITLSNPPLGLILNPPAIIIEDIVPPGLGLVSLALTSYVPFIAPWSCNGSRCENGSFANAPWLPVTFTVTVNVAQDAPSLVTNEASMDALGPGGDGFATASDPTIIAAPLAIATTSVPVATQYQSYNTTLSASGGNPPYTWLALSSTGVSLPEGMSLDPATGIVSATQVNGQGGYAVTVQVTDSTSPTPNVVTTTLNFGVHSDGTYGGCQMFPADSIFNQRIDALPVDTRPSDQIPANSLNSPLHPDFGQGFYPNPGGIPFLRVPANQALSNVSLAGGGQIDQVGTYSWPFPAWPSLPTEGSSYGAIGDHHLLVLQSSVNNVTGPQTGACTLYETYQNSDVPSMYNASTNTWSLLSGAHYLLNSDAIAASEGALDSDAQDATGIPIVPLLIKYSEVPLGVQHPLRINMPSPTNGWVWPATGCCGTSGPPAGLLYRLKASVNWQAVCPASTNPQAATVLQALQQYGAYMSNHGSAGFIQGVPDDRWSDNDLACIKNFPLSDLEVVNNSVLEVSDISGQTQPYVAPATMATGAVGAGYSSSLVAVGGNPATLQRSVTSGGLPPGLTLNASTGAIGGIPTSTAGSPYGFTVTVTDTASGHASQAQTFSIAVTPGSQTVNFGTLANEIIGVAPFTVTATATSGFAVTFSSQTTTVCTVSGSTVTLVSVGLCTIQATQTGSANWAPASLSQSFQVTALPCDLKQNGNITAVDVQLMINQALGVNVVANDLNGDGVVNAVDVQIVVDAALKMGCLTSSLSSAVALNR